MALEHGYQCVKFQRPTMNSCRASSSYLYACCLALSGRVSMLTYSELNCERAVTC